MYSGFRLGGTNIGLRPRQPKVIKNAKAEKMERLLPAPGGADPDFFLLGIFC